MRDCILFLIVMFSLLIGMAIGQWGIESTHQYELNMAMMYNDAEQVRHKNEADRMQLAYRLQCQSRVAEAIYQIDSQTKGKWKLKLSPWIVL